MHEKIHTPEEKGEVMELHYLCGKILDPMIGMKGVIPVPSSRAPGLALNAKGDWAMFPALL